MSSTGAQSIRARDRATGRRGRQAWTPAQWLCLLAGLALVAAGALGFIADASFDTSSTADVDRTGNADGALQGDGFLGLEVNGWHNLVHIASGLVLLACFSRRRPARLMAIAFGLTYAVVAAIGLVDGNDVVGLIPVNGADNVLHIALAGAGIVAGLASPGTDEPLRADADETTPGRRDLDAAQVDRTTAGDGDRQPARR